LRTYFKIEGIHCGGCINAIDRKLMILGANHVAIDVGTMTVKIDFVKSNIDILHIIAEIKKMGYKMTFLGKESLEDEVLQYKKGDLK